MYLFNLSQYIMLLDCCSCSTRSLKIFLVLCHYFRVCFNVEPMCLSHLSKKVSSNCIQCIVIIFLMRLTLCLIVCKQEHLKQCLKLLSKRTGSRRWSAREFQCRILTSKLTPKCHRKIGEASFSMSRVIVGSVIDGWKVHMAHPTSSIVRQHFLSAQNSTRSNTSHLLRYMLSSW